MKLILVVIGILVLVVGGILAASPPTLSFVSNQVGITGSVVTYDRSMILTVKENNYSYTMVALVPMDNLSGTIQSNPPGVEFLLMNQGNFSEFSQGIGTVYQIYTPPSSLNVGNYSFSFAINAKGQNYYLVFKAPSTRNISTDVLLRTKVTSQISAFETSIIPILLAILGLLIIAFGALGGRKKSQSKEDSSKQRSTPSIATPGQANQISGPVTITKCRFCGASMRSDTAFCTSCGKSQK